MKNKTILFCFCVTALMLTSCGPDLSWMQGTWESSNRTLGFALNPNNGAAAVRTILLEDKWIPGRVKVHDNTIIFTNKNNNIQLEFTFNQQEKGLSVTWNQLEKEINVVNITK